MRFLRLLGLVAVVYALAQAAWAAAHAIGWDLEYRIENDPGMVTLYAIALLCTVLFIAVEWGKSPWPTLTLYWVRRRRVVRGFLLTFSISSLGVLGEYFVFRWLGTARWLGSQRVGSWAVRTLVALGIVVLLAATEELIFRGFVFNYLRNRAGCGVTAGAVIGSALIFALAHHFPDLPAWLSPHELPLLVGLLLLGSLLAITYVGTRSLACAAGVHAGLLNVEVFARNRGTRIVTVSQSVWWMGGNNDLRTAPVVWAHLVVLALVIWWARGVLARVAGVEDPTPIAGDGVGPRRPDRGF